MKKRLKKGLILLLCMVELCVGTMVFGAVDNGAVYPITTNEMEGWPQGPEINGETAVLMEAETGTVLYDKGMKEIRYPASITKVMTALVALENSSPDEMVTFTEACKEGQGWDSSNSGMEIGEVLTMEDCVKALLVKSANDVAIQIAVHISGSVEAFAQKMNERAVELGCENTHFVNPNGLPDEEHYTTAYDMALIFRAALEKQEFVDIISSSSVTIGPSNVHEARSYSTHLGMILPEDELYYEGCIGGKTGYTNASLSTLVTGAKRDGMTLITVVLRSQDTIYSEKDHMLLFDYGFDNFKKEEVEGGMVVLPKDREVSELKIEESKDNKDVRQEYYYQGTYLVGTGSKPEEIEEEEIQMLEPEIDVQEKEENLPKEEKSQVKPNYHMIIVSLCGLILVGIFMIVMISVGKHRKKKKRKKR